MRIEQYIEFLASKQSPQQPSGFETDDLHSALLPFQRYSARWALARGKAAIFANTGLGKTLMQLVWSDRVCQHTGRSVLILAPLCVAQQTVAEAGKFGIAARYCRQMSEVQSRITVTNYEMLARFDASQFVGVVLDESSILKNFTGATKRALIETFKDTPYKLACTATPAPNDYLELGNHAEFLDVMPSNEMISRFFINDTMSAGSYRLKGHARESFWEWCASWALAIAKPSDLGFEDTGFDLPPLDLIHVTASTDNLPGLPGQLFRDPHLSAANLHQEMRLTAPRRADAVAEMVAREPAETWLIWCNSNYEAEALIARLPQAVEIRGSMTPDEKTKRLQGFLDGSIRVLVTKPSIAGFGLNLQHCARMAFVGLSYSYEDFYQAVRRCWRYGQKRPVTAYMISADSELCVLEMIQRKEREHRVMQAEMSQAISRYSANLIKPMRVDLQPQSGIDWDLTQGDCVIGLREMADDSVDLSVFSPPFANLYIYSDSINDMGNTRDADEFIEQYRFVAHELYRVTRPGRLCVIHCKDLPRYKNRDGAAGLYDFPADLRRVHEDAGWTYHSRVTIWKDPVIEMQRTKNHGLLYKQLCKDSAASRQGMADYLLVMRKWGDEKAWEPVTRGGERFFDYIGSSAPAARELAKAKGEAERQRLYSIAVWQRYASPVWFDIQQTNVLNIQQAREGNDEKHIAPLQLDVIERAIELWSNPGDLVLSPFAGIGSEGVVALKMGRRFVGFELKESYFNIALKNLLSAKSKQVGLFESCEEVA